MAGLRAAKKELRALIRERLSQLSPELINQQSATATEAVLSLPEYKNAQCIGVYLSMPQGELATKAIVHDAFRQGKQIFVPYIYAGKVQGNLKSRSAMNMVSLISKSDYEALRPDVWGIPTVTENSLAERSLILEELGNSAKDIPQGIADNQPSSRLKSKDYSMLDMIIMPGLAFDGCLERLGHGKGYYDRFLKRYHDSKVSPLEKEVKMPFLVGLALDVQFLVDSIPTEASDWRLDALVVGDGSVIRS